MQSRSLQNGILIVSPDTDVLSDFTGVDHRISVSAATTVKIPAERRGNIPAALRFPRRGDICALGRVRSCFGTALQASQLLNPGSRQCQHFIQV